MSCTPHVSPDQFFIGILFALWNAQFESKASLVEHVYFELVLRLTCRDVVLSDYISEPFWAYSLEYCGCLAYHHSYMYFL